MRLFVDNLKGLRGAFQVCEQSSFLLTLIVVPGVGVEPTFTYQQGRDTLSQGSVSRIVVSAHRLFKGSRVLYARR